MTIAVTLSSSSIVAPGNETAISIAPSGLSAGDRVAFQFAFPPDSGLSCSWNGGTFGGPLGVTLQAEKTATPGTYAVPYTCVVTPSGGGAATVLTGTYNVLVTSQLYAYSLAQGDRVQRALGRLTSAFRNQPNCQAILKSLCVGIPELNNVFWQIINQRVFGYLVPAVAAGQPTYQEIDLIGGLVGEERQGRVDGAYLPAVMVRIRVNQSKGGAEDVIQVSNLVDPGATYDEYPNMHFAVSAWNLSDPNGFAVLLGQTKATGSYGVLNYSTWPFPQDNLYFNDTPLGSAYGSVIGAGLLVASTTCVGT